MASGSAFAKKPALFLSFIKEVIVNPFPDVDGRPRQAASPDVEAFEINYNVGCYSCSYVFLGGEQDGREWLTLVKSVKDGIARVNAERVAADHVGRVDADDYRSWMADVHAFKDRLGVSAVPLDICLAMNGVEAALELPQTPFGY